MKMRKTICLITNWYPTDEKPFYGLFFKEQAFAVADNFDFVVIHIEKHTKCMPFQLNRLNKKVREQNTTEYYLELFEPFWLRLADFCTTFRRKIIARDNIVGIGNYLSSSRSNFIKKKLYGLFDKYVEENIDVFYCINAQSEAFLSQFLANYCGKPYVVSEHAPFPYPGGRVNDANKYAIENANLFMAISCDKIRQVLMQNIKLPQVYYLGNYIDETLFIKKAKTHNVKSFITIASLSFYKNNDMFIRVMDRLTEITSKDFNVIIAGYGINSNYEKKPWQYENDIKKSKFANKAIMIPTIDHKEVGKLLNDADAFVFTSIQEGQPVSVLEAGCCGLPIFSTRCGGVEDYIDNKMGRIYDLLDYEGMAEGLKSYLEDEIEFDGDYIRNRIVNRFGKKTFVTNFTCAFNTIISSQ